MSFSVVVVLHDSAAELRALLASIDTHLPVAPQLVVVDSGSRDDGAQVARDAGAEVVVLDGNPGFGAANNAGLARARHDVTVLLNPDCVLLDAGLARLAALAGEREALVVPRLLNADGSLQRSAHPLPAGPAALVRAVLPTRALPEPHRATRPREVGWAIAACVAARTSLLRRLGPFDPSAFLFYEDLELCLRAREAGVPTVLHPEIALRHVGGHSTGDAVALKASRRRAVVGAHLGRRALAIDDAAQALTFLTRAAIGRRRAENVAELRALRAARRD
ncbi:MAG: glycosyltransferase family 2 protein [Solirubrobacteraceae bacterium]